MRDHVKEIRRRGAELVIIGNGAQHFARAFREDQELDCPVLIDPDLTAYDAAGLRRGRLEMLSPRVPLNGLRALAGGYRQGMVRHFSTQFVGDAAIRSLHLTVRDRDGEVAAALFPLLAVGLLTGAPDPAAKAAELKSEAIGWLRSTLPTFNLPDESIETAVAVVTAFPRLPETLHVAVDLPAPVGMDEVISVMKGEKPAKEIFPAGAITVRYGDQAAR